MQREEIAQELAAETIEVPQFRILGDDELLTRVRKTKGDVSSAIHYPRLFCANLDWFRQWILRTLLTLVDIEGRKY